MFSLETGVTKCSGRFVFSTRMSVEERNFSGRRKMAAAVRTRTAR
jgi:hypothetical protein